MAIATVNSRYEGFIFDGENSRDYGVYVTDVEVFGTPERDVEVIDIPGRNGAYMLDRGRFKNIEVTYHCAMGADSQGDFNDAISDLRNMLASRIGYKRLEDEINTSEYRMACYKSGLDVPMLNKETGTFEVKFDCKPQRFLKSGETKVEIANSYDTITNPTMFPSLPLLEIDGYGLVDIGGQTITIAQPETPGLIYVDCDIMESYQIIGGVLTPCNGIVTLGGNEYPKLTPGANVVGFDVDAISITPRWWTV